MTTSTLRLLTLALALIALPLSGRAADLTFLMSLFQLNPAIDGLNGAEEVVITADGRFAYVASDSHIGQMGESGGIAIFDVDEDGGTIAYNSVVDVDGARALALSPGPTNQHLYVAAETTDQILWFTRDAQTGLLTPGGSITGDVTIGLDQAWSVAVSADGLHVYVVGLADNSLAVFDRAGDGSLTHAPPTYFDAIGMPNPFEVRLTPDDGQVLVATQGDDANLGVAFDRIMGNPLVTPPTPVPAPLPGRGVSKSIAVSPDNSSVYFGAQTATSQNPSIAAFDRDPVLNTLTASTLVDDPNLSTVVSLEVSPDGRSVIAAADISDRLLTYTRAPDGTLTFFESILDGFAVPLDGATSVAITESGDFTISVAKGGTDDAIALYAPEPGAAALTLAAWGALAVRARRRRRNS